MIRSFYYGTRVAVIDGEQIEIDHIAGIPREDIVAKRNDKLIRVAQTSRCCSKYLGMIYPEDNIEDIVQAKAIWKENNVNLIRYIYEYRKFDPHFDDCVAVKRALRYSTDTTIIDILINAGLDISRVPDLAFRIVCLSTYPVLLKFVRLGLDFKNNNNLATIASAHLEHDTDRVNPIDLMKLGYPFKRNIELSYSEEGDPLKVPEGERFDLPYHLSLHDTCLSKLIIAGADVDELDEFDFVKDLIGKQVSKN